MAKLIISPNGDRSMRIESDLYKIKIKWQLCSTPIDWVQVVAAITKTQSSVGPMASCDYRGEMEIVTSLYDEEFRTAVVKDFTDAGLI